MELRAEQEMEHIKRDISEHSLWIRYQLPQKWVTVVLRLISQYRPGLTWTEDGHQILPRTQQNWSLMQGSTFHLGSSCVQYSLMSQGQGRKVATISSQESQSPK